MWSSNTNPFYQTANGSFDDPSFLNFLSQDDICPQGFSPLLVAPLDSSMHHSIQMNQSSTLSLDIQPCISITEPTPVTATSFEHMNHSVAQHSSNLKLTPQASFLDEFFQTEQEDWLSWTPNIQLSPAASINTIEDFDINSFHSLDLLNQIIIPPVEEDHLTVQPTKRTRTLSEPPAPIHSKDTHKVQSIKRSRSNSAGSGSHPCRHPGCSKIFNRPYNLSSHMRTHTTEKPFACSHCGRKFARQHDRNRHEKLHWGIKPFSCQHCTKTFARMDALNRHLRVENGCTNNLIRIETKL